MNQFSNKGFAALLTVILILSVGLMVGMGISLSVWNEQKMSRNAIRSAMAYYASESGIEDAVYRLKEGKNLSANYTLTVNSGLTEILVNTPDQNHKIITANANVNNAFRKIETRLSIEAINPDFFYGAQAGALGIVMENNSRIEGTGGTAGNIYSNGPVNGDNGATITGDVSVATGITYLDEVIVLGDARANTITNSKICGDAYYQTIDSGSFNFLNNPSRPTCLDPLTPGTAYPNSLDPPLKNMPISDSNINTWKQDAENGGTYSGDLNISTDMSFGPKKIEGNLLMRNNNKILTVTGTIYVTGYIDIGNGSAIRCDASYGSNSCVVITDKWVHIKNNSIFRGSGQSGSYIMILSTSNCDGTFETGCTHHNAAMDLHNNAVGAIFYANDGLIYLHNGVEVSELTAKKIELSENAIIRYERGLIDASFSSGPAAGWEIDGWKEVP